MHETWKVQGDKIGFGGEKEEEERGAFSSEPWGKSMGGVAPVATFKGDRQSMQSGASSRPVGSWWLTHLLPQRRVGIIC